MRSAFFKNVTGGGTNAVSMGFSTISYLTKGEITLDETKLRKALQENPQQVADVLTDVSYESNSSTKFAESGVFARINDSINTYINDYTGYRTESKNTQYKRLEDSMDLMETRLQEKEERYWNQFTRMEEYLSQMNTQSSWLSQQFSSSGS
jgi:flagellar hook-associated protein 2